MASTVNQLQLTIEDFEERFLPGTTVSSFKENIFRKRAELFDSGNALFYSDLFRHGDLTKLLEGTMLHRPSIRLVGNGTVIPMSDISYSVPYGVFSFENIVDVEKVGEWYKKGYTINVRGAHYNHPGLARCTSLLQQLFSCNIRSNLYLTPTAESGLVPHYDVHDVFVIQVHGCKRWQFFSNNFDRPTENFRYGRQKFDVGQPTSSIDLKPGQILYLPRGVSHSATALDESLHITLGIEEPTLADLLRAIAEIPETEPQLRENIDCDRALNDPEYLKRILPAILGAFSERFTHEKAQPALRRVMSSNLDRSPNRNAGFLNGI